MHVAYWCYGNLWAGAHCNEITTTWGGTTAAQIYKNAKITIRSQDQQWPYAIAIPMEGGNAVLQRIIV